MSLTPASDSLRADHRRIEVHLDALLAALLQFSADRLPEVRRRFLEIRELAEVRRFGIEFHDAIQHHRLFRRMQAIGAKLDA